MNGIPALDHVITALDWSYEDDNRLIRYCNEYGAAWREISQILQRPYQTCKVRWIQLCTINWLTFPTIDWVDDDVLQLLECVHFNTTIFETLKNAVQINWAVVANTVQKNETECRNVWWKIQHLTVYRLRAFTVLETRTVQERLRNWGSKEKKSRLLQAIFRMVECNYIQLKQLHLRKMSTTPAMDYNGQCVTRNTETEKRSFTASEDKIILDALKEWARKGMVNSKKLLWTELGLLLQRSSIDVLQRGKELNELQHNERELTWLAREYIDLQKDTSIQTLLSNCTTNYKQGPFTKHEITRIMHRTQELKLPSFSSSSAPHLLREVTGYNRLKRKRKRALVDLSNELNRSVDSVLRHSALKQDKKN